MMMAIFLLTFGWLTGVITVFAYLVYEEIREVWEASEVLSDAQDVLIRASLNEVRVTP